MRDHQSSVRLVPVFSLRRLERLLTLIVLLQLIAITVAIFR
jgi:hypothetical protein